MPSYNNAARDLDYFQDDEEYRQSTAARRSRPNVPPMPNVRMVGTGGELAQPRVAPPAPLPGSAPRRQVSNVPSPNRYGYPEDRGRRLAPPAPRMSQPQRPAANPLSRINLQLNGSQLRVGLLIAGVVGVLIVSYLVVSFAVHTWQVWQDDMTYGRPRITRLEASVGHNELGGAKTVFIAQNINGQVSITEFPGGDPSKTRVIVGPRLFGKEKDLVPIKLQIKDVNADGQADLIATADEQQLVYINENGNFRPINDQERAKLKALDREDGK